MTSELYTTEPISVKRWNEGAGSGEGPTGRIKFGTESNGGFKNSHRIAQLCL